MKKIVFISSMMMLSMAACSELNKVTEMHDATVKMSTTTEEMKGKTQDLDKKTQELKDMTDELYDALRQGNSLQLRREAFESVLKAPSPFKKVSEATKYFMSFEFQVWNVYGQDQDIDKRDILAQQAAQEFFMEVEELAPTDNSVDPMAIANAENIYSRDNLTASFNAMAMAMDQINRKQRKTLTLAKDAKPMSVYSLMEEALLAPRNVPQKGYMREVLAHEEKALQLLQTRYNVFTMVFVNAVSKIGDKNIVSQGKMLLNGWDFNPDQLNATQVEYLQTEGLQKALDAKNLLLKIGKKPVLDSKLVRLLEKMNVQSVANLQSIDPTGAQIQKQKLLDMIKEIQK